MKAKSRQKTRTNSKGRKKSRAADEDGISLYKRIKLEVTRTLSSDEQHFRYRVLESTIPVRNNLL